MIRRGGRLLRWRHQVLVLTAGGLCSKRITYRQATVADITADNKDDIIVSTQKYRRNPYHIACLGQ